VKRKQPDDLPSSEDALAALSSRQECEKLLGPLRRNDIIDYFKRFVEMAVSEETEVATITPDPEIPGGEIQYVAPVQSAAVPVWMLAQAVILLKTARPGRKPPMSFKQQRLRLAAKWHYQRKKKELGSADAAASHVSDWLRERGVHLDKGSILKGGLSRRSK
jgi:hypothetical protein